MKRFFKNSAIFIALSLIVGAAYGAVWYIGSLRAPQSSAGSVVQFRLTSGTSTISIASQLQEAGIIRSREAFTLYLAVHGLRGKLQAGVYSLTPDKTTAQIADILSQGKVFTDSLLVPEGATISDIRTQAIKKGITGDSFDSALKDSYGSRVLLANPDYSSLEGYLFPDSYTVTGITTAHDLIAKMLSNLDNKIIPNLEKRLLAKGFTVNQALTLASIIDKEVSNPDDKPIVAQIFMSRLSSGTPLGSDVTVLYAAKLLGKVFDTAIDSPYNTYRFKGLPPGPICSPGLADLEAIASPAATNYMYFLADKTGKTHFAKDYAEHQRNIALYLNK